jgi:uncharacterized phage infection (PIP) family protein YhgE
MATTNAKTGFGEPENAGEQTPENIGRETPINPGQPVAGLEPTKDTRMQADKDSLKATANDALNQIKTKTSDVLTEQKSTLTSGLSTVAQSIRQVSNNLRNTTEDNKVGKLTAQYGSDFAGQIDRLSRYVESAELQDLADDLKGFARRQPALFLGGAFTLGLLLARFLKTSRPTEFISEAIQETTGRNRPNDNNVSAQPI